MLVRIFRRNHGITVYQEQVMLCLNLCRIYKGEADVLVKQWVRNKRGFG
jgi:DNA polymerase III alpha subunit